MTRMWTIRNEYLTCSDFTLKDCIKGFLLFSDRHGIKPGMFELISFKASHDEHRGAWEETETESVWIDQDEGLSAIYEALK